MTLRSGYSIRCAGRFANLSRVLIVLPLFSWLSSCACIGTCVWSTLWLLFRWLMVLLVSCSGVARGVHNSIVILDCDREIAVCQVFSLDMCLVLEVSDCETAIDPHRTGVV